MGFAQFGGGSSFTPAAARAAQLKRVAPAGTTLVTLTPESPRDYGTAASGTFTVDATNCVVGVSARFAVGTGATAPSFINAPANQRYEQMGDTYVSGYSFFYSLLVCVDCIQVVILAR